MALDACAGESNIEGGSISGSTILESSVVNSTISASEIDSSSLTNLSSIDTTSTKAIVDAIASLPRDQLATLSKLLFESYTGVPITGPSGEATAMLPTTVLGGRDKLLGTPTAWVSIGGYAMPLYTQGA